ncbi:MAG TPA: hypothetical protein VGW37_17540 [Terriglobia bacterium]|nr:hypothetical protein [Terriglobia bacterium]
MKNTLVILGTFVALSASLSAQSSQCLIVRSAEGHRFRNSMIAGALTGGIGFAAGAAFSGAKYEYADSFNLGATKTKYTGKELEKLQSQGVHVIVVEKKTASAEMDSARNSCRSTLPAPAPQAAQAVAPQTTQAQAPNPASAR